MGGKVASAMLRQGCHGGKEGHGHMQASPNQNIDQQHGIAGVDGRAAGQVSCRVVRSSADLGKRSSIDLGSTSCR